MQRMRCLKVSIPKRAETFNGASSTAKDEISICCSDILKSRAYNKSNLNEVFTGLSLAQGRLGKPVSFEGSHWPRNRTRHRENCASCFGCGPRRINRLHAGRIPSHRA